MRYWLWLSAGGTGLGVAVTAAGFVYHLALAGIPYQAPTPEMEARWRYHDRVGSATMSVGAVPLLLGLTALGFVAAARIVRTVVVKRDGP